MREDGLGKWGVGCGEAGKETYFLGEGRQERKAEEGEELVVGGERWGRWRGERRREGVGVMRV